MIAKSLGDNSEPGLNVRIPNMLINLTHSLRQILGQRTSFDDIQVLLQLLDLAGAYDDGIAQAGVEDAVIGRPAQSCRVP